MTIAAQTFPCMIQTFEIKEKDVKIYYPQVVGFKNIQVQQSINQKISHMVYMLIQKQYQEQNADDFTEITGAFEVKTNERDVLSITFSNYAIAYKHANGINLLSSLTLDTQTGEISSLQDLFKQNSSFMEALNQKIFNQIEERDIPLINHFQGISYNQNFYIADKVLVLYFQSYEITPGYMGAPMFPVSVYELQDIINDNGLLGRMLASH